jgi:hypothetical protein
MQVAFKKARKGSNQQDTSEESGGDNPVTVTELLVRGRSNTVLKQKLEDNSSVDKGGGWWIELHCGALFFCCRCETSRQD